MPGRYDHRVQGRARRVRRSDVDMQTFRDSGDSSLVSRITTLQDKTGFKELHWDGSLEDYLKIVRENQSLTRTAIQRSYDMILSHAKTMSIDNKKRLNRYQLVLT